MNHPLVVKITEDGKAAMVYHPDKQGEAANALTSPLGVVSEDNRGARVYPLNRAKRTLFKALRCRFGGKGRVAEWTRRWRGPWVVVVPGEHVRLPGEYRTHGEAVEAEVAWILWRIK